MLFRSYFGAKPSKVKVSPNYKPAVFGSTKKADRLAIDHKKTDQVQMMLGWPGFKHGAKENTVLRVLNTILGGSMSSRLFIQVRERKGLAYVVRSGASSYRDTGYVYVQAGLEPKNVNKAITCIQEEIKKFVERGLEDFSISRLKAKMPWGVPVPGDEQIDGVVGLKAVF